MVLTNSELKKYMLRLWYLIMKQILGMICRKIYISWRWNKCYFLICHEIQYHKSLTAVWYQLWPLVLKKKKRSIIRIITLGGPGCHSSFKGCKIISWALPNIKTVTTIKEWLFCLKRQIQCCMFFRLGNVHKWCPIFLQFLEIPAASFKKDIILGAAQTNIWLFLFCQEFSTFQK